MNNRLRFFARYYIKKHLGSLFNKNITADDLFHKRFYRMAKGVQGTVIRKDENEIIYTVKAMASHPLQFYIRTGVSSDVLVFSQVFKAKEYEPLVNEIREQKKEAAIQFIIDAGANVGYTSVLLKHAFPSAFLLAVEPDSENAEQIRKNLSINKVDHYLILQGGLWSTECWLQLKKERGSGKQWAFYVVQSDRPTDLKAYSLPSLLNKYTYPTIDILKIDIEGSEAELFKDEATIMAVLQRTRFLAIEIHDDLADRQWIYAVLKKCNFSLSEHGELTIATNLSLL
jgi:FkbM family methyltransferase